MTVTVQIKIDGSRLDLSDKMQNAQLSLNIRETMIFLSMYSEYCMVHTVKTHLLFTHNSDFIDCPVFSFAKSDASKSCALN